MGTDLLSLIQPAPARGLSLFGAGNWPSLLEQILGKPQAVESSAEPSSTSGPAADLVNHDTAQQIADEFDAVVYRSQVQRLSLTVAMQQAAARVNGSGPEGDVDAQAAQLTFTFFAESKTQELVRFNQRTQTVGDGLNGFQRETYIEASRKVAQRFSLSLSISGSALNGFAGASEKLSATDGSGGIDQLVGLANDALSKTDEVLNKIFELLDAFFSSQETDFQKRFNELLSGLQSIGLIGAPDGQQGDASGNSSGQQVQFQQASLEIQLEFKFSSVEVVQVKQGEVQQSDPITFDLDGDGIELTSYANGARFDILGDGRIANTAFVTGGDAFLAIDRNGNRVVDSGKELFGDQNGAENGFEELRKLDSNNDGVIDARDKDFSRLRLFRDNGNGATDKGELISLAEARISEIRLAYQNVNEAAPGGNRIGQTATFVYADGRHGRVADTILNYTV